VKSALCSLTVKVSRIVQPFGNFHCLPNSYPRARLRKFHLSSGLRPRLTLPQARRTTDATKTQETP
jgi:hypothetical protein